MKFKLTVCVFLSGADISASVRPIAVKFCVMVDLLSGQVFFSPRLVAISLGPPNERPKGEGYRFLSL